MWTPYSFIKKGVCKLQKETFDVVRLFVGPAVTPVGFHIAARQTTKVPRMYRHIAKTMNAMYVKRRGVAATIVLMTAHRCGRKPHSSFLKMAACQTSH